MDCNTTRAREQHKADAEAAHNAMREVYGPEDFVGTVAFVNIDTSDKESIPSGQMMMYKPDAVVNMDSIPRTIGEYIMVSPILPMAQPLSDAFFQTPEMRAALNENVPQYNRDGPTYDMRHPRTSEDTRAWGPELGRENGMVGVFKILRPDGRNADYFLVSRAGVPEAAQEMRKDLAENGIGIKFRQLVDDPRLNSVAYLGRRNGYKLLYAAKRALGVPILQGEDGDHYIHPDAGENVARPYRAEPEHVQSISSIESLPWKGDARIAVYNGVSPLRECREHCYVVASPYDGIVRFKMDNRSVGIALPATTGRRPDASIGALAQECAANPALQQEITHRAAQSSIMWEADIGTANEWNPDMHPHAFYGTDRAFLKAMQQSGWDRDNDRELMIPVLVKISNPLLKRPST